MVTVTDEALMTAVRDGDLAKLGLLFERYHAALFDFLSRMTGDRTAAEDLNLDSKSGEAVMGRSRPPNRRGAPRTGV